MNFIEGVMIFFPFHCFDRLFYCLNSIGYTMKHLFLLALMTSISASASDIVNKKNGERISAECVLKDEKAVCIEYSIKHHSGTQAVEIVKYRLSQASNSDEVFLKREQVQFKYLPLTKKVYQNDEIRYAMGVLAGGAGVITWLGLWADGESDGHEPPPADVCYLCPDPSFYWGAVVAAGILALPTISDVTSMPVRALIHGVEVWKANRDETLALNMLGVLADENASSLQIRDNRFNSLIDTLKTISK